jgi:acyl-ACP thioesterase
MVDLHERIKSRIDVVHIGNRSILMKRQFFTGEDGSSLGYVYTGMTLMNMEERKACELPDSVLTLRQYLKTPASPNEIALQIEEEPFNNVQQEKFYETVKIENIDSFEHVNFTFNIAMLIRNTKLYFNYEYNNNNNDKSRKISNDQFEEISIVYRNEMLLGDRLESCIWTDPKDTYYCRIKVKDKLCSFLECRFHNHNRKSKI